MKLILFLFLLIVLVQGIYGMINPRFAPIAPTKAGFESRTKFQVVQTPPAVNQLENDLPVFFNSGNMGNVVNNPNTQTSVNVLNPFVVNIPSA